MRKVIKDIENLFAKYDCYSLHDLEEQSESFGCSEYDKYYYEDLDKAIFKIEINEKRTFYTLSFREEKDLLLAVEEMNKCSDMIKDINRRLSKIERNE